MVLDCKKQVVTATIITPEGETFVGKNYITNDPGDVCPRDTFGYKSGEGYELCKSVCGQLGHAETVALGIAGKKAFNSILQLEGHTYVCDSCKEACRKAGIREIRIVP